MDKLKKECLLQNLVYLEGLFKEMNSEDKRFFSPNINVWLDVKEDIELKIISGEYKPGDQIPPIRKMASIYNIGVTTAQKVMDDLYHEGTVTRKRGVGFFVKPYVKERLYRKHKAEFEEMFLKTIQYAAQLNIDDKEMREIFNKLKK